MRPIRFEEADAPERTRIGEGLTRFAVDADGLGTGRAEGKYSLRHGDGRAVRGAAVAAGDPFYLDPNGGTCSGKRTAGSGVAGNNDSGDNYVLEAE